MGQSVEETWFLGQHQTANTGHDTNDWHSYTEQEF